MHISALLTVGLALTAAAAPNAARKTKTKTTTTPTTTTTTAASKPTQERCFGGNIGGFKVQCDTGVFNIKYLQGKFTNQLTQNARTIQACTEACAATKDCCAGNFDIFEDDILNVPGCSLLIKPAGTQCSPEGEYSFTHGGIDNDVAGFFKL